MARRFYGLGKAIEEGGFGGFGVCDKEATRQVRATVSITSTAIAIHVRQIAVGASRRG